MKNSGKTSSVQNQKTIKIPAGPLKGNPKSLQKGPALKGNKSVLSQGNLKSKKM